MAARPIPTPVDPLSPLVEEDSNASSISTMSMSRRMSTGEEISVGARVGAGEETSVGARVGAGVGPLSLRLRASVSSTTSCKSAGILCHDSC